MENELHFELPEGGQLTVTAKLVEPVKTAVSLYLAGGELLAIDAVPTKATVTRVLIVIPGDGLEPAYLAGTVHAMAQAAKLKVEGSAVVVPANQQKIAARALQQLTPLLTLLGVNLAPAKKRPAKAQHRWNKAVSTVPFHTEFAGTKATIIWQKRNEMRLLAGAVMKPTPELNADGSLGFSARFANQLRGEHADAFTEDFVTTADIILKSTNEAGLFLYFGTTNSWLQFKDDQGRTIDDYTVVR